MNSFGKPSRRLRKWVAVIFAGGLAVALLGACGSEGAVEDDGSSGATGAAASSPAADGSGNPALPPPTPEPDNDAVNAALVGMSAAAAEEAASAAGYTVRIAVVDGEPRALTMDYRTNRINLELANDVVVRASVG
jgi:hypothetical protein